MVVLTPLPSIIFFQGRVETCNPVSELTTGNALFFLELIVVRDNIFHLLYDGTSTRDDNDRLNQFIKYSNSMLLIMIDLYAFSAITLTCSSAFACFLFLSGNITIAILVPGFLCLCIHQLSFLLLRFVLRARFS